VIYGMDKKSTRIFRVRNYDQTHINPIKLTRKNQTQPNIPKCFQSEGDEKKLEVDSFDIVLLAVKSSKHIR
jgi:hypothetical protein